MSTVTFLATSSSSNLLWAEWISFSVSVSLIGVLVIYCSNLVPESLQRVFKYGKAADLHLGARSESFDKDSDPKRHFRRSELPKRWFFHFYLFALAFYATLAASVVQVYLMREPLSPAIESLLNAFVGSPRRSSVTPESVVIAMALILAQVTRRLSECTLLSVYSNAKMNIVHYIFGFSFYFGVGLSVLAEAPGFCGRGLADVYFGADFFRWHYALGIALFIVGSVLQFQSHAILADLRKDVSGRVVTYQHSIPRGQLFDYVSCPHYFAEIVIYMSINLVFGGQSTTWWMVCCFVVTNQIVVGLFNHHWYLETFKDYPKERRAVIPFVL